jgi:outer membrane protein assembly factor BamB
MRFAFLALVCAGLLLPQQWPQFRGPNATGVAADEANPPIEFSPSNKLLWKQHLPVGHSSPAVAGDRIFLTSFTPESKKLELICISAKTGAILWRRAAPPTEIEETHVVSNPATATPAVDEDRVYAYFSSFGVMAFDYAGESKWTLPLPMPKTHHGSGASPILAGDLLILNHDAMKGGYLLAVDRRTGKEAWRQEYPAQPGRVESYSTPIVFHDQLVLHRAGVIEGYQIATGKRLWSTPETTSGASTPTADQETLYVSTWYVLGEEDQRPSLPDFAAMLQRYDQNHDGAISEAEFPKDLKETSRPGLDAIPNSQNFVFFRRVDRNQDGSVDESEWEAYRKRVEGLTQDHGLLALRPDGAGVKLVWRENTAIPEVPSPLLYRGRLYLIRNGGVATCLDAANGKLIYRSRVGSPGVYYASPIAAAGRVYVASGDGVVTVIEAGKDELKVLARNEIGEDIVATPAIAGKVMYIRTLRALYAFGDR